MAFPTKWRLLNAERLNQDPRPWFIGGRERLGWVPPVTIKEPRASTRPFSEQLDRMSFDDALDARAIREFLLDPRHHLVVAVDDGVVIGFTSAVHAKALDHLPGNVSRFVRTASAT
jgi:hypothetical protein